METHSLTDSIESADSARWTALLKLTDTVQAIRALPEDAPQEQLAAHLEVLEGDYVQAWTTHQDALCAPRR